MRVANLLILIIAVLMTSCFKDDESESLGETSGFLPGDGLILSGKIPVLRGINMMCGDILPERSSCTGM